MPFEFEFLDFLQTMHTYKKEVDKLCHLNLSF